MSEIVTNVAANLWNMELSSKPEFATYRGYNIYSADLDDYSEVTMSYRKVSHKFLESVGIIAHTYSIGSFATCVKLLHSQPTVTLSEVEEQNCGLPLL